MGKYAEYVNEGAKAFIVYATEKFLDSVEETETQYGDSYNDKTLLSSIRENTEEFIREMKGEGGSKGGLLKLLNKNPILDFSLGIVGEHVLANQEKINEFFKDVKNREGTRLYDLGYGESLFLRAINRSQSNGLFGKDSGIETLMDKLIADLPEIVNMASVNNPNAIMAKMILASIGITPESIKEAYNQAGFKGSGGVIGHVVSSIQDSPAGRQLLELGKLKLQEYSKNKGCKIDLSELDLDKCVTTYKLQGLDGKEGLINLVATSMLGNQKELGGRIFSLYTNIFAEENIEAVKKVFKEELGYAEWPFKAASNTFFSKIVDEIAKGYDDKGSRLIKEFSSKVIKDNDLRQLVEYAKKNPPLILKDGALLPYIKEKGVIGEEGLFAYLAENMPQIMFPFVKAGVINEEEVKDLQSRYTEMSGITDAQEMIVAFQHLILPTISERHKEKGATFVELAQRAESLGITPYELLTSEEFSEEKAEWFKKYFGENKLLSKILPALSANLEGIVYSPDIVKTIEEAAEKYKSKTGLLNSVFSYIKFQTERDPAYVEKIRDYLKLVKDLSGALSKRLV